MRQNAGTKKKHAGIRTKTHCPRSNEVTHHAKPIPPQLAENKE
jgi:hypothetical protein